MTSTPKFPLSHALLAVLVVAVWGTNFVVIRWALDVFTPLWLATMRFAFALLPAVLLLIGWRSLRRLRGPLDVARPDVAWRDLLAFGVLLGAGQFGLLFTALNGHISPGLASLVIQVQVFFTIGLSMITAGERLLRHHVAALLLAISGLVLIATHTDGQTTPLGLAMVTLAAACWACGNIIARRAKGTSSLGYVVWSSFGAVPPLLVMAWLIEGPQALITALPRADAAAWLAVIWQTVGNTWFGYGAWGWLLQRHAAAQVVPWALLVPVFGMGSAVLVLGEAMPWWKVLAAALVLAGLALNLLWPLWRQHRAAR